MSTRIPALNMTVGGFIARFVLLTIVVLWTLPTFGLLITSLRDKDQITLTGWWTALQTIEGNNQGRTGTAEDMVEEDGVYVLSGSVFEEETNKSIVSFGGGFLPENLESRTVQESTIPAQEAQPEPADAEEPDAYVISGSFLELGSDLSVITFGGSDLPDNEDVTAEGDLPENITDYNANQTVELADGLRFQLDSDGNYEIRSDEPFSLDEDLVVSYVVEPDPWLWYEAGQPIAMEDGTTFTLNADGTYRWESPVPFELERGQRFFYVEQIPPRFSLENYREVLEENGIGQAFINTFTVTIPATIIPIAIAAFASYAFAWMEFPGRRLLFAVVVGLLVVPLQMSLIPLLKFYNNLSDILPFFTAKSYPGIWLAHTGFGLPLAIYLLHNYISGLPREIIESAKIDGASHFMIFVRLILPLSVPALASFAIFQFLWVWNDLLVALVFLSKNPDQIVMTSQIRELIGSRGDNWEILTSGAFVSMAVPLLVFFSLQRYFVRGLLAGSVKGG